MAPRKPPGPGTGRGGNRGGGAPTGALTKISRVRAHEIVQSGSAPLDVMLNNMRWWFDQANAIGAKLAEATQSMDLADPNERAEFKKLLNLFFESRENAQRCAVDAAPYIHPKLASLTVKGDKNNPIPVEVTATMDAKKAAENYALSLNADRD